MATSRGCKQWRSLRYHNVYYSTTCNTEFSGPTCSLSSYEPLAGFPERMEHLHRHALWLDPRWKVCHRDTKLLVQSSNARPRSLFSRTCNVSSSTLDHIIVNVQPTVSLDWLLLSGLPEHVWSLWLNNGVSTAQWLSSTEPRDVR